VLVEILSNGATLKRQLREIGLWCDWRSGWFLPTMTLRQWLSIRTIQQESTNGGPELLATTSSPLIPQLQGLSIERFQKRYYQHFYRQPNLL
jgi:hypothetical protein